MQYRHLLLAALAAPASAYTHHGWSGFDQGDPVLRAENLFVAGRADGLRSSPA